MLLVMRAPYLFHTAEAISGERTAAAYWATAARIYLQPSGQWLAGKRGTERCHVA